MKASLPDHYNTRLCVISALLGFNLVKQLRTPITAKTATNARGAGSEYVARGKWSEFISRAESSPPQADEKGKHAGNSKVPPYPRL